jgi:lysozyme
MKTSPVGLALIQSFESCKLKAYPDPKTGGAPWTVGWGATGPDIGPSTVWTQAQADARFASDVSLRESVISKEVTVPLKQGQFDAMVSILFNVGPGVADKPGRQGRDGIIVLRSGKPSTLLRKLNAGDYDSAADQFLLWISPGSSVENGLKRRRTQERCLFLTGSP